MRFAAILNAECVEVNDSLSCRLDRCVKETWLCKAPSFRFLREIICRIYSFVSVFIFFRIVPSYAFIPADDSLRNRPQDFFPGLERNNA